MTGSEIPTYSELKAAHYGSANNRITLERGELAGCFYCKRIFQSTEIIEWTDSNEARIGQTALCPYCGVDSVLGASYGYPITNDFLSRMNEYWFGRTRKVEGPDWPAID